MKKIFASIFNVLLINRTGKSKPAFFFIPVCSRSIRPFIFFLPILFIFLHPVISLSSDDMTGQIIEKIVIESPPEGRKEDLMSYIDIKKGQSYSASEIRRSLKHLFIKGLFSEVYVEGRQGKSGMILTFHLKPKKWVYDIKIKDNHFLTKKTIRNHLPVREGNEFDSDTIARIEKNIVNLYKDAGYYNASVSIVPKENDGQVTLTISIDEGRPSRIKNIIFRGDKAFDDETMKDILKLREGDHSTIRPLDQKRRKSLEEKKKDLLDYYLEYGYLETRIPEPEIVLSEDQLELTLIFDIFSGSKVDIVFQGNDFFSDKKLLKIIAPKGGETVNTGLIQLWETKIIEAYLNEGFPFIEVKGNINATFGKKEVSFVINEGERFTVGNIAFRGNEALKDEALLDSMTLHKGIFSRPFSWIKLDNDIDAIKNLYIEHGFLNAEVQKLVNFDANRNKADIIIPVDEGVMTVIDEITFAGSSAFGEAELLAVSGLKKGIPYNPAEIERAKVKIAQKYSKNGYIHASIQSRDSFSSDNKNFRVELLIDEGPRVRVGEIIIKGNRLTREPVMRRELTTKEGDIFDPEKILKDRQNILRLGLFRGVKYSRINREKIEAKKDMLLEVSEKKPGVVEIGAGYSTDLGIRGFVESSYTNLGGTARSIRLKAEASGIENKLLIGYTEPWIFGRDMDGRINLIGQETDKDSYDLEKYGIIIGVDKELTDFLKLSLQYSLERNRYFNVAPGTAQEEGNRITGTIGPMLIRDSRDDPFNPRAGSVNLIRYEIGDESLISDDEFQKVTVQSSWYRGITKKLVAAISVRGGYIELRGDTLSAPIDKRFFLGGRATVRGYKEDSIGPENIFGVPVGGEKMINFNVEIRADLIGNFGVLFFGDGGNVWRESEKTDPGDLRTSVGMGIRYKTPIGPLSLEYGRKTERKPGESAGEWYFTIGNTF